jgi:hypothetical protein
MSHKPEATEGTDEHAHEGGDPTKHEGEADHAEQHETKTKELTFRAPESVDEVEELVDFAKSHSNARYIILSHPSVPYKNITDAEMTLRGQGIRVSFIPANIDLESPFHPLKRPSTSALIMHLLNNKLIDFVEDFDDEELEEAKARKKVTVALTNIGKIGETIGNWWGDIRVFGMRMEAKVTRAETEAQGSIVDENILQYVQLINKIDAFSVEQPDAFAEIIKDNAKELETATNQQRLEIILRELSERTQVVHSMNAREVFAELYAKVLSTVENAERITDLRELQDLIKLNEDFRQQLKALTTTSSLSARLKSLDAIAGLQNAVYVGVETLNMLTEAVLAVWLSEALNSLSRFASEQRAVALAMILSFLIAEGGIVISAGGNIESGVNAAFPSAILAGFVGVLTALARGVYYGNKLQTVKGRVIENNTKQDKKEEHTENHAHGDEHGDEQHEDEHSSEHAESSEHNEKPSKAAAHVH